MQFHKENYHVANTNIIIIIEYAAGTVEVSEEEERIFISSLYLLPPYQNKGIGTAIIAGYTHKATGENKRVELKVLKLNVNAQRFYKRLDFTLTERDDTQYFMYKDCK